MRLNQVILFVFVCLGVVSVSFAQSETYSTSGNQMHTTTGKPDFIVGEVAVVPFSSRLYKSHFDKELIEANTVDYETLRDALRSGLNNKIREVFDSVYTTVSMYSANTTIAKDLDVLYSSFHYNYKPVPKISDPEEEKTLSKWKDKVSGKTKKQEQEGARIENGQIVSVSSTGLKYMGVDLEGEDVLLQLREQYKCSYILSLTQFELIVPMNVDPLALQSGEYMREIKVHYSIVEAETGKEYTGGLVTVEWPSSVNDLKTIEEVYFSQVAEALLAAFPENKALDIER